MKFNELRDYLENKIKLGKITVSNEEKDLGTRKKYQFIAILTLFQNNGKATKQQIKEKLKDLSNYSGLPEVFTSIQKKNVAREINQDEYEVIDFNEYSEREKTIIINICEEKIQQTKSWVIKPGYLGDNWKVQLEKGIIGISIQKINLSEYYDEKGGPESPNKELKNELEKIFPLENFSDKPNPTKSRRGKIDQMEIQLHDVARIQKNDFIYAYDTKKFLGIGRVVGDYNYQENENFCHTYKVDWYDVKGRNLENPKKIPYTIHPVKDNDKEWVSGKGNPQSEYWIYVTSEEHWKILKRKKIWGSVAALEKINQKIHPGDKTIFYVKGTHSFKGCFEFDGDWYPAEKGIWTDEDNVDYRSQINLKPLRFGNVDLDILKESEVYKQRLDSGWQKDKIVSILLRAGQGYPANNNTSLSEADFNLICKKMDGNEMSSSNELKKLAKNTHMKEEFITEIENELNEQKQIIFAGPPGTSKTFFARKFAEYFTGNKDNIEIIQFHPSYNYEDFVEGIRPKIEKKKNVSGYEIKDGILKKSNIKAFVHEKSKIVLIIDEINRGNISRIFGELIYLLEYREDEIKLTYSSERPFKLQDNLYIIGTMNTADRSIALMDYAIRRRFAFFEFKANSEVLSKWMDEKGISKKIKNKVVSFMDEINNIIAQSSLGEECQIGQSYFMKDNIDKTKLEKIFNYKILPLLKEYYFADKNQIKNIESKFQLILSNWNKDEN